MQSSESPTELYAERCTERCTERSPRVHRYERRQYRDQCKHKAAAPVDVYGAEHLLRLFVKSPVHTLLLDRSMAVEGELREAERQVEHLKNHVAKLTELLKFLQANKAKFFANEYEVPTDEYVRVLGHE